MIRFFRKIRQRLLTENKFSKYLFYAIGEIILVVIGILIALQINTWNDRRIQNDRVKSYAQKLIIDLAQDIKNVNEIKYQAEASYLRIDSLSNYARLLKLEDYNNLDLFLLIHNARYKPFSWNRASFEEVKSSGILNNFDNDTIVNLLVNYEAFTRHLDLDYQEDRELIQQSTKLMSKVINYNYKNDQLIYDIVTPLYIDSVEIIDYQKEDFYRDLEKQSIDFTDRNKQKFEEAINAFLDLNFNYRIRYRIELPRLINDAKVIIKLLEENYLSKEINNGIISRYPTKELSELLTLETGIDRIIELVRSNDALMQNYDVSEMGINKLGLIFMFQDKNIEALKIFKLNAELYPNANTLFNYAESLFKTDDKNNAIKAYEKVLELDPNFDAAIAKLKELQQY